ncbi:MAG: polyisoprenoid-binding protein [bacterium]|nr:MAG: polyisoprenoid-binding protein [bacterium]
MRFTQLIYVAMAVVFIITGIRASDKYVPDKAHTNIGFTVKHMVIATVPGKFGEYTIDFMFDENDLENSSIEATIKTASIDTDNEKRDNHLRSADFFNAEKHPEITFVSKEVIKKNDQYIAKGTLTIRGVSKQVELPFKLLGPVQDPWGNTRLGVEAGLTIDRQDYGVSWNKTLDTGGLVVSDEVNIKLDVELQKEG